MLNDREKKERIWAIKKILNSNNHNLTPEQYSKLHKEMTDLNKKFSNDGKYKYFFNGKWVEMPIVCTGCAIHPPKLPIGEMKEHCIYIKYIFPLCEKNHCEGDKSNVAFCSLKGRKEESTGDMIYSCSFKRFEVRIPKKEYKEDAEKSYSICGNYNNVHTKTEK